MAEAVVYEGVRARFFLLRRGFDSAKSYDFEESYMCWILLPNCQRLLLKPMVEQMKTEY
ncbi:hypothetical protein IMCC3135_02405 [Granulosicoccus antarcticus IMCC3135]|uniref:Uncharacterized protein n=1 Tax=Granulosicoccus antarcticus IMCC3135 TaxID=1192854 RepID=A0A2Z2NU08_9GAMM|nr:hypothetical protein IMCC3135_02405 [Granulosicoccus antarcticus IMCC3135]